MENLKKYLLILGREFRGFAMHINTANYNSNYEIYSRYNGSKSYQSDIEDNYVENLNILIQYRGSSLEQDACLLASCQNINAIYVNLRRKHCFIPVFLFFGAAECGLRGICDVRVDNDEKIVYLKIFN